MYVTTLSIKNQITIPKFLLNMIGVKDRTQFLISKKDDILTMRPIRTSLVDELAGSLSIPKNKRGIPFNKVREIMAKKVAYEIANS